LQKTIKVLIINNFRCIKKHKMHYRYENNDYKQGLNCLNFCCCVTNLYNGAKGTEKLDYEIKA